MVLSASSVESYRSNGSPYSVFERQVVYAAVGLVLFWVVLVVPLRKVRALSTLALLISVLSLVLVLTPLGGRINGGQHWFRLGVLSYQPVEVAKVALALWGAHVLVAKRALLHRYRHLLVPVVPMALLLFTLVMLQPDLGSTVILMVVLVALLWNVGAPMWLFGAIALGTAAGVVVLAVDAPYRLARVLSFLNPHADPLGDGLQARQALYALADGGLFGKGLGQGSAKWLYLPHAHNDFIFAVVGEELGLVGCVVVLALFALLAVVGTRIALRNTDPWIRLVASTLTIWLVAQAAINIGYVLGLLPVTGIPLPMFSSGGTSLAGTMLGMGILASCARHEPEAVATLRALGPGRVGTLLRLPAPEPCRLPMRRRIARPFAPARSQSRRPATSEHASRRHRRITAAASGTRRYRNYPPVPDDSAETGVSGEAVPRGRLGCYQAHPRTEFSQGRGLYSRHGRYERDALADRGAGGSAVVRCQEDSRCRAWRRAVHAHPQSGARSG
ncbi:putative lipid II flippase FtsW [Allokutzneria oryzae]|uniref:Probable peptidoglycan glycosyltransferase FtsW n=1 Tax=Allokutzneria oryzae TaxID=1378989 RepID=A0ABV5ZX61_9PSEU